MREDIKHLIESRPIWKEQNPVDPVETKEVPRVKESIEQMQAQDPEFFELIKAFVIAKREGDEPTAKVVLEIMDEYKNTKN